MTWRPRLTMVSRAIWNGSQKMAQMISAMAVMKLLFCMTSSYLIRIETWLKVGEAAATAIKAKRAMMNFIFVFLVGFQNLILIFFLVCYRYDIRLSSFPLILYPTQIFVDQSPNSKFASLYYLQTSLYFIEITTSPRFLVF